MLHGCGLVHRFEHRAKNQTAVFKLGAREGIKLTWNIWQSHETAYMTFDSFVVVFQCYVHNQRVCIKFYSLAEKSPLWPQMHSLRSDSYKRNWRPEFSIHLFCCEGKILLTLFGDHIFPSGDWKKIQSPVGTWLKKLSLEAGLMLKMLDLKKGEK